MLIQPRHRHEAFFKAFALAILPAVALIVASPALAQWGRHHWVRHWYARPYQAVSLTDPAKDAALIEDGATGKVLYSRNADVERHPASLTKMMTLYLLFDAMKQGRVSLSAMMPVSEHASEQKPTNLHLWAGDSIPVETAIKAIVVRSANDVAVVIAEYLGGTESHFAEMMTAQARALGMRSTFYHNASGLPDDLQITTAADLGLLARHLAYDFPQYFHYFSTPSFYFRGTTYVTHDNLIGRYDGADGIKTGYTQASGFNLVSSVVRGGAHVIGVVMGGRTAHMRDREMVNLLDNAFTQIAENPALVARNGVPWQTIADNAPLPPAPPPQPSSEQTPPPPEGGALAMLAPPPNYTQAPTDEDAAEAQTNEGNIDLAPQSHIAPLPKPAAAPRSPSGSELRMMTAALPRVQPAPKPFVRSAPQPEVRAPIVIAANKPQPKPTAKPVEQTEVGEGDISYDHIATTGQGDWTIQIGAFADQSQARAQLAAYAEKSMDVLGQASRIVAPFKAVDGRTMYRARFGPFAEREAREVCSRLTERGQTCFAAAVR